MWSWLLLCEQPHVVNDLPRQHLIPSARRPSASQAVSEQSLLRGEPRLRRASAVVARPKPLRKLHREARHPFERVLGMGPPPGGLLRGKVGLQSHAVDRIAGLPTPVRSVPRERLRHAVIGDGLQERFELRPVVPGATGHADRQGPAGRRPGEDMELGEVLPRLGVVVRPPRPGAEEHEARGIDGEDLLDRPKRCRGLGEEILQRVSEPVTAVVLLQRVEVRNVGESEGWSEEVKETDGPPEAQVEVRSDEEAQDEFPSWNAWTTPPPFPVVDRARFHEVLQEPTGEQHLLTLPTVVLPPVSMVDTTACSTVARGQGGIPSRVRWADLSMELGSPGLSESPALEMSDTAIQKEFVCTPLTAARPGGSGAFETVKESMSVRAAEYQEQVTGRPARTSAYVVRTPQSPKGVRFDDYRNGRLVDAKGPGYSKLFGYGFAEAGLLRQAERQTAAAQGTPIEWNFAEEEAALHVQDLFATNGVTAIAVLYVPMES